MEASIEIESLAKASAALTTEDMRRLQAVCEAGESTLQSMAAQLVAIAAGSPILNSKTADGTPITVVTRTEHQLPSGQRVIRSGRHCEEYLLKNQFLRTVLPSGQVYTRALLQDPSPLIHGKKVDQIFQACLKDYDKASSLEEYLESLPETHGTQAKVKSKSSAQSSHVDEDVHALPWLAELDLKEGFAPPRFSPPPTSAGRVIGSEEKEEVLEEALFEEVMKKLAVARMALQEEGKDLPAEDYHTRVLGGPWLMKTKGIPFDAIQGFARSQMAKEFCQSRSFQQTFRSDYNAYGSEACGTLCRSWAHRMQWLLNQENGGHVSQKDVFSKDLLQKYSEPSEFVRLADDATGKLLARVKQIRAIG
jgi:hypothetical protein